MANNIGHNIDFAEQRVPVVILDVLNLRADRPPDPDSTAKEEFNLRHFQMYEECVASTAPGAAIIKIVDGNILNNRDKLSKDLKKLVKYGELERKSPKYVHILPAGFKSDRKYLSADPVIVQLLYDFNPNCAAVTYDAIRKPEDLGYFPEDDPMRRNIFRPLWNDGGKQRRVWGLPSKNEIRCFVSSEEWYESAGQKFDFFSRLDQNAVLLLEDVVGTGVVPSSLIAQQRVAAYQYVDEFVARHRELAPKFPEIRREPRPIPTGPSGEGVDDDSPKKKRRPVKPRVTVKPRTTVKPRVTVKPRTTVKPPMTVKSRPRVGLSRVKNQPETVYIGISAYLDLEKFRDRRVSFDAVMMELNESFFAFWLSVDGKIRVRCDSNLATKCNRLVRITGRVVDIDGQLVVEIKSAEDVVVLNPYEAISVRAKRNRPVTGTIQFLSWSFRALPGWKRRPRRLPPPPPATLPRRPESLRGEVIGTKVRLTWQEPNYNGVVIEGYRIEQSKDGGEWSPIEDVAAQPCEKTVVDLKPGVNYKFCVSAEGAAGFGSRSEPLNLGSIVEVDTDPRGVSGNGGREIVDVDSGDDDEKGAGGETVGSSSNYEKDEGVGNGVLGGRATEQMRGLGFVAVSGAVIALIAIVYWLVR